MKFSFEVGDTEKFIIDFNFNQIIGNLSICVDKQRVVEEFRMFSLNLKKVYEFKVGKQEVHNVRIEKKRKLLFAGFRKSTYKVIIDGILSYEYYLTPTLPLVILFSDSKCFHLNIFELFSILIYPIKITMHLGHSFLQVYNKLL